MYVFMCNLLRRLDPCKVYTVLQHAAELRVHYLRQCVRRRSELEWLWDSHFNDIATAVGINSARGSVRGRAPVPCRRYPRGNVRRLTQG